MVQKGNCKRTAKEGDKRTRLVELGESVFSLREWLENKRDFQLRERRRTPRTRKKSRGKMRLWN